MLTDLEKILFLIFAAGTLWWTFIRFRLVYQAVRRGQPENRFDNLAQRFGRAIGLVLIQQPVFKKRPLISFFHAMVFYGFVFYLLVNVVDVFDGYFLFETRGGAWNVFNFLADIFSASVLIGIVALMLRRFLIRPSDFTWSPKTPLHEKVRGGIPRDSAIVGSFIFFHVGSRLMGASAGLGHEGLDSAQPVASAIASAVFMGAPSALFFEHMFWWFALGSILLFFPYFAYSKHIHIFLAPVNIALKKKVPGAYLPIDFEDETKESYGVAKLEDFTWPRLLDAYSCIMCNRCAEVCPATTTGKALNPAAILISERYELNQILPTFAAGQESPRPLLEFALNDEAAFACTTCMACIEVCPVGNEQMVHIIDVRRERVMTAGEFPQEWNNAFRGMERNGNPWGLAAEKRLEWTEGLPFKVQTVAENPDFEMLYWVGCAPAYDPRAQKIARAMAQVLNASGKNWAILGTQESCTGDAARRAGNEYLFAEMAKANIETLNETVGNKPIVTTCPHCFHTIGNDYQDFGGHYNIRHHSQFLEELLKEGQIQVAPEALREATFHDPCYLGRHNRVFDAPREVLQSAGVKLTEPERRRENSFCCGAGGAQFWKEEEEGAERVPENRYRELRGTGVKTLATGCPFCMQMFTIESQKEGEAGMEVMDLAELVAQGIKTSPGVSPAGD